MRKGFTLVELLAVVLIVGILTAVGLPQYRRVVERSHAAEAESMLRIIYDSSERLAGEFGYRSYQQLISQKGNESNYSFARLDMFDKDNLPRGCSITSNITLTCQNYSYRISQGGYVAAKKLKKPYQNTYILLDRNNLELYCQPSSSSADECDVFGLDVKSAGVAF